MKISDIVQLENLNKIFGLSRELHITEKIGNIMELISWNRDRIITTIKDGCLNLG